MLSVVLLVALGPVTDPGDKPEKLQAEEMKRLAGVWKTVKFNAKDVSEKGQLVTFKGDQVSFTKGESFRFQIDPSKDPKWFDFVLEDKDEKQIHPGIYKLDGDTLTIFFNSSDLKLGRPKRFDEKFPGQIIELERVKKK